MFIVIINFPPIKTGKDAEFREWFILTNKEFANHKGLISPRLLKPIKGGNYAAIVEHESQETFMAMHDSPLTLKPASLSAPCSMAAQLRNFTR